MPAFISFGMIYCNSPNQNAGIFIGQNSITGFDANQKFNIGHGAAFGNFNLSQGSVNFVMDSFEYIDGMMNDMDVKITSSVMV